MAAYSMKSVARMVAALLIWVLVLGGIVWAAGQAKSDSANATEVSAIQLQLNTRDRDMLKDGSCATDCDGTPTINRTRDQLQLRDGTCVAANASQECTRTQTRERTRSKSQTRTRTRPRTRA